MFRGMILSIVAVVLLAACHGPLLVRDNAAFLSIEVDVPNKALLLTYEFESPARTVRFAYRSERARRPGWSVLDPGIDLNGHVLSRADSRPIERVTVKVVIEGDSTDSTASGVRAIGDAGLLLHVPFLSLQGVRVTGIAAHIAPGQVVVHEGFASDIGAETVVLEHAVREPLHVFFGDRTALTDIGDSMLVASADPENTWLMAIRNEMEPAMQWIDAFFGSSGRVRPIVFVFFSEDDDMDIGEFSGTATSRREILMSFKGPSEMWEGHLREDWFGRVVFPNLVHAAQVVWRGFPEINAVPSWLMQGLSGYLALIYVHTAGGQGNERTFLSEMERMASECLNILEEGGFGIAMASAQAGTTIYDECGVLAFWLIDGRPATAHRADRVRTVMAQVRETPGRFGVGRLRRAMESAGAIDAWEPLQLLIEGPRGRLWQRRDRIVGPKGICAPGSCPSAACLPDQAYRPRLRITLRSRPTLNSRRVPRSRSRLH